MMFVLQRFWLIFLCSTNIIFRWCGVARRCGSATACLAAPRGLSTCPVFLHSRPQAPAAPRQIDCAGRMRSASNPHLVAFARAAGVEDTLRAQDGVILRTQALAGGMPRTSLDYQLRSGHWRRVLPGVLAVDDPTNPAVRMWAAWLWAGPNALVGGRAALYWTGLLERCPPVIDVYLPLSRCRRPVPGIRTHRAVVDGRDRNWIRTIAVTSVARSCLDLARWRAPNDYLDLALRRREVTVREIQASLARSKGCTGIARATEAAKSVMTHPWSPPERALHAALTAAGITGWVANRRTSSGVGTVFPDVGFKDVMLAVEINGRRYHDEAVDRDAFERTHRRAQALVDGGWIVLHFTASQVFDDPRGVVATIMTTLRRLRSE